MNLKKTRPFIEKRNINMVERIALPTMRALRGWQISYYRCVHFVLLDMTCVYLILVRSSDFIIQRWQEMPVTRPSLHRLNVPTLPCHQFRGSTRPIWIVFNCQQCLTGHSVEKVTRVCPNHRLSIEHSQAKEIAHAVFLRQDEAKLTLPVRCFPKYDHLDVISCYYLGLNVLLNEGRCQKAKFWDLCV